VDRGNGELEPSNVARNAEWADAVVPHLEAVEISDWSRLQRTFGYRDTSPVLKSLWEDGTLTWERILDLLRQHTPGASTTD